MVPSKSLFLWGLSILLLTPQVGISIVGPRTFATVQELLWYNCSAVCGSSARWLCGGINGDLLQEDLCCTPHLPGLLQPEPLSLRQATADPCLHRRPSNTQRQKPGSTSQVLTISTYHFTVLLCLFSMFLDSPHTLFSELQLFCQG